MDVTNQSVDLESAYALPPKEIADALLDVYFSTVHQSFPLILQPAFMMQYNKFMNELVLPDNSKIWLAILNTLFGIGAIYTHLSSADWRGDVKDHLQYIGRAQALFLDSGLLFNIPNMMQVQALAVAGIYLVATSQINR